MKTFQLVSDFELDGDQPKAVQELTDGLNSGEKYQTLLGVTGSGKTFTMANVIATVNKPTLIISHNKTLAAQLYGEMKAFFPNNAVEYFISYYDYYQPEAYIATTDTYIEKDTSINDEIDRLRLKATSSLLSRQDVVIVASVSCIYGLGTPEDWVKMHLFLDKGQQINRDDILKRLVEILYNRNDVNFERGTFRVRGDILEVIPAYETEAIRIEMWGDEIERLSMVNTLTGEVTQELERVAIYPAKHFVTPYEKLQQAIGGIQEELEERLQWFRDHNKLVEAQRLEQRTNYDLEMMQEIGYCSGVENYSRHLSGRNPGEKPATLIDYFPKDFLLIIDESHVSVPQIGAMYAGDRARKENLVEYGFRLPSALDNRPLNFNEFETMISQAVFVSATPADYEMRKCGGVVSEQIIRPTGLMDPEIIVKPVAGQIDDLIDEIDRRTERKERVLVTTLTKRMSEDLTDYLAAAGIKVRYMHSEIVALDRVQILRDLRLGEFDVLVGINLLREGLDLPEVSLVAVLDADKEGFLRSTRSLIQTAGRAARNVAGQVIFYADRITDSMRTAIDETNRRREIQQKYNKDHGITPKTIYKSIDQVLSQTKVADNRAEYHKKSEHDDLVDVWKKMTDQEKSEMIVQLQSKMMEAASNLEFEKAAELRDQIAVLEDEQQS